MDGGKNGEADWFVGEKYMLMGRKHERIPFKKQERESTQWYEWRTRHWGSRY